MKNRIIRLTCDKALMARIDQYRRDVARKLDRDPIRRADAVRWLVLVGLETMDRKADRKQAIIAITSDSSEKPLQPQYRAVKRRFRSQHGRSYERALEYLFNLPADIDAVLVHGIVGGLIYHAWVEIGDSIYDPMLAKIVPADTYSATVGAVVIEQRYSRSEAGQAANITSHAGPWHTAEAAMSRNDDNNPE
jgi:hypothetical protein